MTKKAIQKKKQQQIKNLTERHNLKTPILHYRMKSYCCEMKQLIYTNKQSISYNHIHIQ